MKSLLTPLSDWDALTMDRLGMYFSRVEADSRRVLPGDLFLACQGEYTDGRDFIDMALEKGAAAVLWDADGDFEWQPRWQVPNASVPHLRQQAGVVAAHVYGLPSQDMTMIGITGTNGKTSISHWLAQAFSLLGQKAALIGTVGNGFYGELTDTTHTTPDPVTVQQRLSEYHRQGARVVTMEVSSHGLDQYRVNGVSFKTAVLTNLTRDHLDYHGTMQAYGEAKKRLFYWEGLAHAIVNADDMYGQELIKALRRDRPELTVVSYGLDHADVKVTQLQASLDGLSLKVQTPWGEGLIRSNFLGHFNASNLLACLATLCVNGVALADACQVLGQIHPARGRMQRIGGNLEPLVVIDYAHTPDALEKALTTLRSIKAETSTLYCVFGCGGDRDSGKRPMMGEIAEKWADAAVVTSDNPRTEVPQAIIDDILAGMKHPACVQVDRSAAIAWAVSQAKAGDIVLIAGKGHEDYQDIMGVKHHFSDFKEAEKALIQWSHTK